jgi:outer membrane protein W
MRSARLAVMLFIMPCVLAADPLAKQQFSFFVSPQGVAHSDTTGTDFSGGVGLSWSAFWTKRVSTELSVAKERSYESALVGQAFIENHVTTYPIDALAQYHFLNGSKWRPYVGAGIRYVERQTSVFAPTESRTSFEINGGVVWQFAPHWGLKFDARQLLREDSFYDHSSKGSIGFSWSY